ncbi:importin-5-like protein [Corchorus capsularis]|uniref:Importin-5-like protein n=1 Tax=Corchorus capsularis TaxID=210143 RepID=A0A1R3JNP3_COCAP|nr:importin-5-like protein [Corchorus capsularis]
MDKASSRIIQQMEEALLPRLLLSFLSCYRVQGIGLITILPPKIPGNIMHLLSLVHDRWSPSLEGIKKKEGEEMKRQGDEESCVISDKANRRYLKYWNRCFARDNEKVN